MNKVELRQNLVNWDGKNTLYLSEVYEHANKSERLLPMLLELLADKDIEVSASWLFKRAIEKGAKPEARDVNKLYKTADLLDHWQAKLHLLQIMSKVAVPEGLKNDLMNFCQKATEDENKFVRAWGYNGLFEVADKFPEFREGLTSVFQAAFESEPASVKARIKDVQSKVAKNW